MVKLKIETSQCISYPLYFKHNYSLLLKLSLFCAHNIFLPTDSGQRCNALSHVLTLAYETMLLVSWNTRRMGKLMQTYPETPFPRSPLDRRTADSYPPPANKNAKKLRENNALGDHANTITTFIGWGFALKVSCLKTRMGIKLIHSKSQYILKQFLSGFLQYI